MAEDWIPRPDVEFDTSLVDRLAPYHATNAVALELVAAEGTARTTQIGAWHHFWREFTNAKAALGIMAMATVLS